jgi:anti-sigma-K factor RskA
VRSVPDLTPTPEGGDHNDAELTELRAFAARVAPGSVEWETPPPELWDRISAAATIVEITPADGEDQRPTDVPAERATGVPIEQARRSAAGRADSPGLRRSRTPWLVAAAAAAVVGVIAAGALTRDWSSDDSRVVASAALAPLGVTGEGSAELVETDGSLQLRLSTTDLDAGDGFLEVWVISSDVTGLISLGPLRSDGVYDLPPGFDPAAFPIVDVSVEPIDGVPAHSGASVLRGELTF